MVDIIDHPGHPACFWRSEFLMVVAVVIKFVSCKYPLFLKLLGTSKLRNRDPTFNEIGTQLFMKQGPSTAKIGTHRKNYEYLIHQQISMDPQPILSILSSTHLSVSLAFICLVFCQPSLSSGPVLVRQSKGRGEMRAPVPVRGRWPAASNGQSLPVAFTHCRNYFHFLHFHFLYFYVFTFYTLNF